MSDVDRDPLVEKGAESQKELNFERGYDLLFSYYLHLQNEGAEKEDVYLTGVGDLLSRLQNYKVEDVRAFYDSETKELSFLRLSRDELIGFFTLGETFAGSPENYPLSQVPYPRSESDTTLRVQRALQSFQGVREAGDAEDLAKAVVGAHFGLEAVNGVTAKCRSVVLRLIHAKKER